MLDDEYKAGMLQRMARQEEKTIYIIERLDALYEKSKTFGDRIWQVVKLCAIMVFGYFLGKN